MLSPGPPSADEDDLVLRRRLLGPTWGPPTIRTAPANLQRESLPDWLSFDRLVHGRLTPPRGVPTRAA